LLLIKDGTIIGKWHFNDFPEFSGLSEFQKNLSGTVEAGKFESFIMPYILAQYRASVEGKRVYILILGFLFLTLFIRVFLEDPFIKQKGKH
jgi:hypothetical protein